MDDKTRERQSTVDRMRDEQKLQREGVPATRGTLADRFCESNPQSAHSNDNKK